MERYDVKNFYDLGSSEFAIQTDFNQYFKFERILEFEQSLNKLELETERS